MLRDVALSFCPASFRSLHRPSSPSRVLLDAILTGALQTLLFARLFFAGYASFLALRGHQLAPAVQPMNQTTQAWLVVMLSIEYLAFHPVGLLCAYLALEGFVRFAGGLCVSEVVPSLAVALAIKAETYVQDKRTQRRLRPLAAIPDSVEVLAGGERLRIAASLAKSGWNASRTISINGEWYEVEHEEQGAFPRAHVYILKRAPLGKILRAYEEYDLAAAVKLGEGRIWQSFP
jgi:hypothetical protein